MRVLAFDTATPATTVALRDLDPPGIDLAVRDDPPPGARPGHTSRLLPLIQAVLDQSGEGWAAVDRLAVGVGPGTFTGLRIGIATAHALARARDIELVGVSTLAALALGAGRPAAAVLALIDARRGEVFAAGWPAGGDPERDRPALPPSVLAPEQLAAAAATLGAAVLSIGDGAIKFRSILEQAGVDVPADESERHRVLAREHARLAVMAEPVSPGDVTPTYLRLPDAELARHR